MLCTWYTRRSQSSNAKTSESYLEHFEVFAISQKIPVLQRVIIILAPAAAQHSDGAILAQSACFLKSVCQFETFYSKVDALE